MSDPVWVRMDVVIAIHKRQIAEHGGDEGIRDQGLLESALARPKNRIAYAEVTPDLAELAAAYGYGIIKNHAFVDGNKRVAYVVCMTFLKLNGIDLDVALDEKYATFMKLAEGSIDEKDLAEWIRANAKTC